MGSVVRRFYFVLVFLSIGILMLGYTNCSKVDFQKVQADIASHEKADSLNTPSSETLARQLIEFAKLSLTPQRTRESRKYIINSSSSTETITFSPSVVGRVSIPTLKSEVNKIVQSYGPADIVITMDTSGSMHDDIATLRTELNTFIENLASEVDLRLVLAHGERQSPVKVRAFHCLSQDSSVSAAEIEGAKTFINNIPINVNNESPVQVGIEVFKNKPSCLRSNVANFLFVMSDEDERTNGSAGNENLPEAVVNQIKSDLMSLGIRLYAGINSASTHAAYDGSYIADFSNTTGGNHYQLGNGLGNNLQSFTADLLGIVKNYVISDSDVAPGLIKGKIGNQEMVQGTDFTLSGKSVSLSDAITTRVEGGEVVKFDYMTKEALQFSANVARFRVFSDMASDGCWSVDGSSVDVSNCLSVNQLGMNPEFKVVAMPETVALTGVSAKNKDSVLAVRLNGKELSGVEIEEANGGLQFDASALLFEQDNTIEVEYSVSRNQIVGISDVDDLKIEDVSVNGNSVNKDCVKWSGDAFDVDSCVADSEVIDQISMAVSLGDNSEFSVPLPSLNTVGTLNFENPDISGADYKINKGQIMFENVDFEIPDSVGVNFLERSALTIGLSRRPGDSKKISVHRNGQIVPSSMYTVRRIEPFAIVLNEYYKLSDGDVIEVSANSQ